VFKTYLYNYHLVKELKSNYHILAVILLVAKTPGFSQTSHVYFRSQIKFSSRPV